ncbi:MAG TPA: diguanylate cyclase [Dongiaceae bacterium]|nr:diguanylate cyclase [Dongiaceae bacterium]
MDGTHRPEPPAYHLLDGTLQVAGNSDILYADSALSRLLDIPVSELEGRSWYSLFHPFDRSIIDAALKEMDSKGQGHAVLRTAKADGATLHLYVNLCRAEGTNPGGDYYCLVQNLGARIGYDASQQHYERLFALSNDLLCVASTMGYFLEVNSAFTRVLGYSREELLRTTYLEFIHPDDVDVTLKEIRKLRSGVDTLYFENRYRCKDGSWRWLAWSTPASNQEGILYAVAKDITERKEHEDHLLRLAKFDFLSGLPNRSYLEDELKRAMARAERSNQVLAGYSIDLDNFHDVNERYGREVGDDLIRHMGMRLRTLLRACDFIARIGSDEFFVLAEVEHSTKALHLGDKIAALLHNPFTLEDGTVQVSACVGTLLYQAALHSDPTSFIANAERLMQAQKLKRRQPQPIDNTRVAPV